MDEMEMERFSLKRLSAEGLWGGERFSLKRLSAEGLWGRGAFLPEQTQCGRSLGRALLLRALEDMLRKAPDTGISPSIGAALCPRGTWNQKRGEGGRIPRTLNDE